MTTKTDYADEEWVRLRRAPFVAGMAISIADPGGPIELTKETMATLKATSSPPSRARAAGRCIARDSLDGEPEAESAG